MAMQRKCCAAISEGPDEACAQQPPQSDCSSQRDHEPREDAVALVHPERRDRPREVVEVGLVPLAQGVLPRRQPHLVHTPLATRSSCRNCVLAEQEASNASEIVQHADAYTSTPHTDRRGDGPGDLTALVVEANALPVGCVALVALLIRVAVAVPSTEECRQCRSAGDDV